MSIKLSFTVMKNKEQKMKKKRKVIMNWNNKDFFFNYSIHNDEEAIPTIIEEVNKYNDVMIDKINLGGPK